MEISGRLSAFSPAELLQWAHNEQRTGALVVRRSRKQKRLYFQRGEIVGCLSDDSAEYYGQHLLLYGYLSESALIDALSYCTRHGKRLGLALTELELLSVEEVRSTLRQQIQESVCGLFLWQHGVFYFESEMPGEEEILPQPLNTMGLIMEGTRWVDEHRRFRRLFPHDNVVLRRGPSWPGSDLAPVEKRIIAHVDGQRSFGQVHSTIGGSYFRVLEGAYKLCLNEVLDIGHIGDTVESTSLEMSVYDLLLEQAVEEQNRNVGSAFHLPLEVLGGMHAVWVNKLKDDELGTLPDELRELSDGFDGSRSLREILPLTGEDQGELEFFEEQLRKGNLALLPGPPGSLKRGELAGREDSDDAKTLDPAAERPSWWRGLFR